MQQASLLSTRDFYSPTRFNQDTKNQLWMSIIADVHDSTCDCPTPFAHLLSSIFPPGHQDRDRTINEILARDYKERCHSGGLADEDPGSAATRDIKQEDTGEDLDPRDIDILLGAAAAAAEEEDTSGAALKLGNHQLMTQNTKETFPCPVTCKKQYKYQIQKNKAQKPCSMTGITEGALLHRQLLKECKKTSKLIHLSNLMIQKHPPKRTDAQRNSSSTKHTKKRSRDVSAHSAKKIPAKKKKRASDSSSTSSSSNSSTSKETSSSSSQS
ncbi:hypothetical protein [Torque teno midi virus 5]|uniref:Uncharacterized protein n=1 Tax=Torque teno midi virus 5 TaxID=2065046 RepID=A7VLV4_9VIRU|nr:hypothetical protein [Torque teno midi virus 5]BAF76075.1 hypothetical protein [Torque teno midi virus 5]